MLIKNPFKVFASFIAAFGYGPLYFRKMHFNISYILHLLTPALLALLVHAKTTPGIRADDIESAEALGGILDNSNSFWALAEAIMPRIEEWLVQKPFQSTFSAITNSTSVFKKLVEYVVESERGRHHNASFIYSSNDNVTTVEVEKGPVKDVKLTLLFRASEYGFRSSDFHRICDRKGPTITIVKAENGRMAAAYSGVDWGLWGALNPRGFLASIVDDPAAIGGFSLHKYAANDRASVNSHPYLGPWFGDSLHIADRADRCHESEFSFSILDPVWITTF
jgi:hypothetical protein